jgi:hypothetical protein
MSTFSTMNSETIVEHLSRLHLGGTLYLLEIAQEGVIPRYVLESEGHQEGFSLDNYFRYLASLATQYGLSDCLFPNADNSDGQGAGHSPRLFLRHNR